MMSDKAVAPVWKYARRFVKKKNKKRFCYSVESATESSETSSRVKSSELNGFVFLERSAREFTWNSTRTTIFNIARKFIVYSMAVVAFEHKSPRKPYLWNSPRFTQFLFRKCNVFIVAYMSEGGYLWVSCCKIASKFRTRNRKILLLFTWFRVSSGCMPDFRCLISWLLASFSAFAIDHNYPRDSDVEKYIRQTPCLFISNNWPFNQ